MMMIDPHTQLILYKEREAALARQIERRRSAEARGEPSRTGQSWFEKTGQWLKGKGLARLLAKCQRRFEENPG